MTQSKKPASKPAQPKSDVGQAEVAERVEAEQEKGLRGIEVDDTPNRNYAIEGVTSGAETPETKEKK